MKNKYLLFFLLFGIAISICASCGRHNDPPSELSKLPPATQSGANTFGCLVNGHALVPGNEANSYQCNYIFYKGDYFFTADGAQHTADGDINSVDISTDSLAIAEGQSYTFKTFGTIKSASVRYYVFSGIATINRYDVNNIVTGQLSITKFDLTKQIVSGTFFFKAVNSKGDTVRVTDGRFDMKYTQ